MRWKKILLLISLILFISYSVFADDISTTTCPGAGCTAVSTSNQGSVGIQVTGTWVGTITFESSVDGSTFRSLTAVASSDTAGTLVTTTSSNGLWGASIAGYQVVRIRFSAYTSGTATVVLRTAQSARRGSATGGGGGGSGTVTEVDTTSPIVGGPITTSGTISCDTCLVSGGALGTPASGNAGNLTNIPSANLTGTVSVNRFNSGTGAGGTTYLSGSGTWTTPPGTGGPVDATYITQTPNSTLTNEQALSLLSTGIMNVATTTGVITSLVPTDDNVLVGNGTAWQLKALTDCNGSGKAVNYTASNNSFGCNTSNGTVTSVVVTVPAFLTASNCTITTSGTCAITTTSQNGNLFLASPDGSSGAMTPRAITSNDFPQTLSENSLTGNTTIAVYNGTYGVRCTSACTITLPTVASQTGATIAFCIDDDSALVTLDGAGSETINGLTTRIMQGGECANMRVRAGEWRKMSGRSIAATVTAKRANSDSSALPMASATNVAMDTLESGSSAMWDSGNSRVKAFRSGNYSVLLSLVFEAAPAGDQLNVGPSVNAGAATMASSTFAGPAGVPFISTSYPDITLAVNDYVELQVYDALGGSNVNGSMSLPARIMLVERNPW